MTQNKRLNIHNTDKVFNLNFKERHKDEFVFVTSLNEKQLEDSMRALKKASKKIKVRDSKSYVVFQERFANDALVKDIFTYGGFVTYFSEGTIPYHVIKHLGTNRKNSRTLIPLKGNYTFEEVRNISHASMAGTVVLDIPVVYGITNPAKLIVGMSDIRYRVDMAELSFPPLRKAEFQSNPILKKHYTKKGDLYYLKSELKYDFFNKLRNACSHWKINIVMIIDDEEDLSKLEAMKAQDMAERKGSITW